MDFLLCVLIGYGLGSINPAFIISKFKHKDIRNLGTGNLGTTNTFINFGKGWGCVVLLFDIFKAFAAVKIGKLLFHQFIYAEVVAGCMAIMGHIFPFYTKFHGGKGIACFAGVVLCVDWKMFLLLLAIGCIVAIVVNYGCAISFSAAILFPILYSIKMKNGIMFCILGVCSLVIMWKHIDNIKKIRAGEEMPIKQFLGRYILRRCNIDEAK